MSRHLPPVPYAQRPLGKDELACVYSALILVDDNIPVTAEKIASILKAADVHVEAIWPSLFARALQGVDVRQLITGVCGSLGGGAAIAGGPGAPGAGTAPAEEEAAEKPAAPAAEEEDSEEEDFGFGLFD